MIRKILLIDNYDSFTFNLYYLCREIFYEATIVVCRNKNKDILTIPADLLLISPGPMTPRQSGYTRQVVAKYVNLSLPIIGICLGMQVINEYFSGKTKRSHFPSHGKQNKIYHHGDKSKSKKNIYYNIPSPFIAMRYNSLRCLVNSDFFITNAWEENINFTKEPMSIMHHSKPIIGIQYHPESFLSPSGKKIFKNVKKIF